MPAETPTIPLWLDGSAPPCDPLAALPGQVDVAIIGADLPGLHIAEALAQAGVRVLVLDERHRLGDAGIGRDLGLALLGFLDPPGRILSAVGASRAQALFATSAHSLGLLHQRGWLDRSMPVLHPPAGDQEAGELQQDLGVLRAAGVEAQAREGARSLPLEGRTQPGQILDQLARSIRAHGGQICLGAALGPLSNTSGPIQIPFGGRPVQAELVVLAAGYRSPAIWPWLHDKLYPVRQQVQAIAHRQAPDHAGTTQYGYQLWRPAGRHTLLSGCRWATPHLEAGEVDDTVLEPSVGAAILRTARQRFPELDGQPTHAWSQVQTFTCDGLPIVGPLPGQPRVIACTGWNGRVWAWAMAAAASVAAGILGGTPVPLPADLRSTRFS